MPDKSGVAPDKSGVIPDKSNVTPALSNVAPEESGVTSDASGATPEESGVTLEQSGGVFSAVTDRRERPLPRTRRPSSTRTKKTAEVPVGGEIRSGRGTAS
jgi:hypothetical protein